jgi:hypothetical protein
VPSVVFCPLCGRIIPVIDFYELKDDDFPNAVKAGLA